jgi:Histidine phosphatase superfamily (branch 2)
MHGNPLLCPRYAEIAAEYLLSPGYLNHLGNVTLPLAAKVGQALGIENITLHEFTHSFGCIHTHQCHGFPLPAGLTQPLIEAIEKERTYLEFESYKYPNATYYAKLAMGPLIGDMYDGMMDAMNESDPSQRQLFRLFSAHDTTVMPFLTAFGLDNGVWCPYAGMIVIELWQTSYDEYAIRFIYDGQVQSIPGCSDTLCPFSEFQSIVKPMLPSAAACQATQTR